MNWRVWLGSTVTLVVLVAALAVAVWSYASAPVNQFPVKFKDPDGSMCAGTIVYRRIDRWLVSHKYRKTSCRFVGRNCPGVTLCKPG